MLASLGSSSRSFSGDLTFGSPPRRASVVKEVLMVISKAEIALFLIAAALWVYVLFGTDLIS